MTSENTTDSATNPPAVTENSQDINPSSETGLAATRGNRNGALDGLRGLAVIAVMAYHVVPNPFTGGWLGVDLFFVLSGFLICAMLLREHDRTDAIDYKRFLIRRARRLLPGLILMLIAVLTAASIYEYAGRRKHVAIDVLSSFFQVSNWRLILANESYFANVSVPSPIRHTWSLGVQEQFYFIFPLVLLFLFKKARNWNMILLILLVVGGVSFWRMLDLYVPGTDPSRVYFGTDTRLYELLIGVIGAIWLHRRTKRAASGPARGPRGWGRQGEQVIGVLGLVALATIVYWMFTVNEFSPWLFQGGLALIGVMTLVMVVAATSPLPNAMTKLLANKPLMVVGDQSYSLYIWHWPVIVYLIWIMPNSSELSRQIAAVVITIVISTLSHRLVERPIHQHGLRAFVKYRPQGGKVLAIASVVTVLAGSGLLYVSNGPAGSDSVTVRVPADPYYGKDRESIPDFYPRQTVVLVGASTAVGLAERGLVNETPDLYVYSSASVGCTTYLREAVKAEGEGPDREACIEFRKSWQEAIEIRNDPLVVLLLHTRLLGDFYVDGQAYGPGTPEHDDVVRGILAEFKEKSLEAGARKVAIVNMACHERPDFGNIPSVTRSNSMELTRNLNELIADWAQVNDVAVFDQYSVLCDGDTYYDSVNGKALYDDGLHYTEDSAPIIWQWLAYEIRRLGPDAGRD
uniref:Acyltransferase family protein n=1 Tax=uncultured bacterium A1Q1_fos_2059 TaxID=1256559 RepID=L7VTN1_9BACT|nr:acyltransferase family protein [uncultured bacterium A1Q1_fos_2059]